MFKDKESEKIYPNFKQSQVFIKKNTPEGAKLYLRDIEKINKEFYNGHLDDETYVFYDTRKLFDEYCRLFCDEKDSRESLARQLDEKEVTKALMDIVDKNLNGKDAHKKSNDLCEKEIITELDKLAEKTSLRKLKQKYMEKTRQAEANEQNVGKRSEQPATKNKMPVTNYKNEEKARKPEIDIPSFMTCRRERDIIDSVGYEKETNSGKKKGKNQKEHKNDRIKQNTKTHKKRKISGYKKSKKKFKIKIIIGLIIASLGAAITAKGVYDYNHNKNYVTSYENAVDKGLDYNDFLTDEESRTKIQNLKNNGLLNERIDKETINIIENNGTSGLYLDLKSKIDLYQKEIPKVATLKSMQREAKILSELVLQDEICSGYNEWKNYELQKEAEESGDGGTILDYQEQAEEVEFDSSKNYVIKNADDEKIAEPKKNADIEKYRKDQETTLSKLNKKMEEIESYNGDYYSSDDQIKEYVDLLGEYVNNTLDFSTRTVQMKKGMIRGMILKEKDTPVKEVIDEGR